MKHYASSGFWDAFRKLPLEVQRLARKNYVLPKADPNHPSLQFKPIGAGMSVRIEIHYRALAVEDPEEPNAFVRVWIGIHSEYGRLIKSL